MHCLKVCFATALAFAAVPLAANAQDQGPKVVLVALYSACNSATSNSVTSAGCIEVRKPVEEMPPAHKGGIPGWSYASASTDSKLAWSKAPPPSRPTKRVAVTAHTNRRAAAKQCEVENNVKKCVFVAANSAQGKSLQQEEQYQRQQQMSRDVAIMIPSTIIGYFVPWPGNLLASAGVCMEISTQFDAADYRRQYHQEPSKEQFDSSRKYNWGYCIGTSQIDDAKTPGEKAYAIFNFIAPWARLPIPSAVGFAQQGVGFAQTANSYASGTSSKAPVRVARHKSPRTI